MAFSVRFDALPDTFLEAIDQATLEPNLFERMALLHRAYIAQIAQEFNGAPDTAHTHVEIAARSDAMAREIIMRGLLNRHESK